MEAKILSRPPISGEYEEHSFVVSGNTLWVKFMDDEYLEWVGVFEQSEWGSLNTVVAIPNENMYLVIAGGQGYFVDPNARKITGKTAWDDIACIIYNQASDVFVITDGLRLGLLNGNDMVWSGERISADGINFVKQNGFVITGVLNDLTTEGCSFTFNVNTKEVNTEWVLSENWG